MPCGRCKSRIGCHAERIERTADFAPAFERALRKRPALRVRTAVSTIAFADRHYGVQQQTLSDDVGDFVVRRSDGLVPCPRHHACQRGVRADAAVARHAGLGTVEGRSAPSRAKSRAKAITGDDENEDAGQ